MKNKTGEPREGVSPLLNCTKIVYKYLDLPLNSDHTFLAHTKNCNMGATHVDSDHKKGYGCCI